MTEVSTNYAVHKSTLQNNQTGTKQQYVSTKQIPADEYWRREKRKNSGLIERLYNAIKNVTGLGVGSKKVEQSLEQVKNGEISTQEFSKKVHDYSVSQETSAQLLGDGLAVASSIPVFFWLQKQGKMLSSRVKLNESGAKSFIETFIPKAHVEKLLNLAKSDKKLLAATVGLTALNAGLTKLYVMQFNRIGSKEYKVDENIYGKKSQRNKIQKFEAKEAKRHNRKEKMKADFKNFASGAINGLMMPVMLLGGIVGTPIYLIGNSLTRYFVGSKENKNNKSLGGYVDNLTKDVVTAGLVTAGIAIPLFKKGNYTKVFNKNIEKASEFLSKAQLKKADYADRSAFSELEETLFGSSKISDIVNSRLPLDEQIKKLTEENIFAVKFKQISNDGSDLTEALRENCPPTRTIEEAQRYISSKLGSGYNISKLLGVGTIAETYLAKNPEGKEVCLKVLKEGISQEKILKDKEKFVEIVKNLSDKSEDEKKYLLRNVDDLADGILKEVDFKNELEAAKELVPHTKVANVVKPIEVKNGVYVMEKANGISLSSLVDLNEAKLYRETLEKDAFSKIFYTPSKDSKLGKALEGAETKEEKLKIIDEYIKKIEARTPEFGDIKLSEKDVNRLVTEYMKVLVEQFNKVEKNGKVIHADIHPGNVFIDINALKTGKGKVFTLIDTGNTIKQTTEQSLRSINLTSYIKRANVPDLTEYVLEGASLPKGMTHEEAVKKVSEELNKCFFDDKTTLVSMNNSSFLTLASNIMRKYNILPSDTQLNLFKAQRSANNSLENIMNTLLKLKIKDIDGVKSSISAGLGISKDLALRIREYNKMKSAQEKLNLKQLTHEQQLKQQNNPNMLETNSEKYLIYKLKQSM